MFLIKFLLVIAALVAYSFVAKATLKLLNIPATIQTIATFVVSGAIAGVASLLVYGSMLAEQQGHIGDEPQIFSMFSVSVIIAIVVSVAAAKISSASQRG